MVNAYLLTFGGLLLLGGRAGDLFGRRRVFMAGLVLFTVASLLCGLAFSQVLLVGARALQGIGGALMAPAALSTVITTFRDPEERARVMGIWGFVASGGVHRGVSEGRPDADAGVALNLSGQPPHWARGPGALPAATLDPDPAPEGRGGFDLSGALLITLSLVTAVYAIIGVGGNPFLLTLALLALSALLLVAFSAVERRTAAPLVPRGSSSARATSW